MMLDVGVGGCCCSALFRVGFLCLFSVWFVGGVSSVLFCDVGVGAWMLVLSLLICCCDVGVGVCFCSAFGL